MQVGSCEVAQVHNCTHHTTAQSSKVQPIHYSSAHVHHTFAKQHKIHQQLACPCVKDSNPCLLTHSLTSLCSSHSRTMFCLPRILTLYDNTELSLQLSAACAQHCFWSTHAQPNLRGSPKPAAALCSRMTLSLQNWMGVFFYFLHLGVDMKKRSKQYISDYKTKQLQDLSVKRLY